MFLADGLARIIGFDAQLIFDSIITGVNVLILFAFLSYMLFNPARQVLNSRSEKIKKELDEANNNLMQANNLKAEYEKKLADTKVEIEKMLSDAKRNAQNLSDEMLNKAKEESRAIVERGNKEIELEKAKAIDDLKSEVITISALLASKIIKQNVNEDKANALFKETLDEIGVNTWQG